MAENGDKYCVRLENKELPMREFPTEDELDEYAKDKGIEFPDEAKGNVDGKTAALSAMLGMNVRLEVGEIIEDKFHYREFYCRAESPKAAKELAVERESHGGYEVVSATKLDS
jgi:hypothetical protein